jgi:hypothetical protein
MSMTLRMFIVLALTLLAVTACVIEPYGDGGRGDHFRGDRGQSDYGRRVWHD